MAGKAGGGPSSNKVKQVGVNVGPRSTEKIDPGAVNQMGTKVGEAGAVKMLVTGNMAQVPLGPDVAKNVGKGGPGAGRTLYGQSGSQNQHGPANPGAPRPVGEFFPGRPTVK
jgi:hypothetical protein